MREMAESSSARSARLRGARPAMVARARLFVFLTMLVPLFGAFQALLEAGVPRIEIQIVPRNVTIEVPVDVVVERIVERMVFVPVPTVTLHPWTRSLWKPSNWDLSRLPRPGSLTASSAAFGPSPVRASVFAQPNPAVAAGIIVPGAPTARFGPAPGVLPGPNPFALLGSSGSASQLDLASILWAPMVPLTTGVSAPASSGVSTPLFTSAPARTTASGNGGNQRVDVDGSSDGPAAIAPGVVMPTDPLLPDSPLSESTLADPFAVTSESAEASGPGLAANTLPRQSLRERRSESNNGDSGRTRSGVPTGTGNTAAPPSTAPEPAPAPAPAPPAPVPPAPAPPAPSRPPAPAPAQPAPAPPVAATPTPVPAAPATRVPQATATRVPATPTSVPATRVPSTPAAAPKTPTAQPAPTKTPTPKAAATKTPTPKPAATKTPTPKAAARRRPTPKPAATKTPTPKPKNTSSSGSQGKNDNQGKNQGQSKNK